MFSKIRAFLSRVVHASGKLFEVTVTFGPLHSQLWVGREDPDSVSFLVEANLYYGPHGDPSLAVSVEVGVIKVELYLTKTSSE